MLKFRRWQSILIWGLLGTTVACTESSTDNIPSTSENCEDFCALEESCDDMDWYHGEAPGESCMDNCMYNAQSLLNQYPECEETGRALNSCIVRLSCEEYDTMYNGNYEEDEFPCAELLNANDDCRDKYDN